MGVPITGFLIVINRIYESKMKPVIVCHHKKQITYSSHSDAQECADEFMEEARPIFIKQAEEETSEQSQQQYRKIAEEQILLYTRDKR